MRLSDKSNNAPIPYRDSKLTRLLQPSLDGISKVVIICNISPSSDVYEESLSTLKFAQRAKKIKQTVAKNEIKDSKALIMKYEHEIKILQEKLQEMEKTLSEDTNNQGYKEAMTSMEQKLHVIQEEKEHLDNQLEGLLFEKLEMQSELERLRSMILVSENVKINPEEKNEEQFTENNSKLNDRRRVRLSVMRDSISGNRQSITKPQIRPSEGLLKLEADTRVRKKMSIDDSKVPDVFEDTDFRDTLLLDKLENLKELLESDEPLERMSMMLTPQDVQEAREYLRQSENRPENVDTNKIDFISIVQEQDSIIQDMQKIIGEKDEQIELLKDELELCRSNLSRIQKQLKQMKTR